MESSPFFSSAIFICIFSLLLLSVPTDSANCSSQTVPGNKVFKLCSDLPTLSSFLHWTYDASNSSLSIAFVAPPAKPEGWVAWGINPISLGMIGTQALIAHRSSNGSLVVQPFNISSYNVQTSKISYRVSGLSAVSANGNLVIFATWELPKGTATINQVWQVGSAVNGSIPEKHAMTSANLKAVGKLNLLSTPSGPSAEAPGPSSSSPNSSPPSPSAASPASSLSLLGFVATIGLTLFNLFH
ncbi:cytochrome b561 and DOMON domain-containing protein At3g25290-like [Aristolochia californica]|uniref:cytochrome b561 and DOMON domain-containing protein At3g25290-like n=1 Tax=Aristolochia californica TaxID=171875 RepID=UPI0035D5747D